MYLIHRINFLINRFDYSNLYYLYKVLLASGVLEYVFIYIMLENYCFIIIKIHIRQSRRPSCRIVFLFQVWRSSNASEVYNYYPYFGPWIFNVINNSDNLYTYTQLLNSNLCTGWYHKNKILLPYLHFSYFQIPGFHYPIIGNILKQVERRKLMVTSIW